MFENMADNLNQLVLYSVDDVLNSGRKMDSRDGFTLELSDCDMYLGNPKNRHLYLNGRKSNIFATLAEIFWVMAGKDEIDPFLSFFLPRAEDYSDDGKTWRGAYGPRLWEYDQIGHVVDTFLTDGIHSRRPTMAIWQPEYDTVSSIENTGIDSTKDLPCSQWLGFWIRDNKLNCKLQMRSNDLIWGLSHINVPEFTFLQEIILRLLYNISPAHFKDVDLGYYHHSVLSLHIYDRTVDQAKAILHGGNEKRTESESINAPIRISDINDSLELLKFFEDLYGFFCKLIREGNLVALGISPKVTSIFAKYAISTENNQLYYYAALIEEYIRHKQGVKSSFPVEIGRFSPDLYWAIKTNSNTPKEWDL